MEPILQTTDFTSTFTFHVARCDKIYNSLYQDAQIYYIQDALGCVI